MVEYKFKENSDQLVAFGNETFEYDGVGNPTRYRNMTAEWSRGRVLTRLTDGTNTVEYTYDGRGYRTSKKVIGANATYTVTYIYAEGKLLREETGTKTIDYIYGSSGIIGIKRNGERYLFRKNMFGDVTHIYNESGEIVGKYSYTAFGECTVDLDVGGIASENPIRYRGYYYDEETNLYYLKTRYYDAELGRFMTIDGISHINSKIINGLNLYAYCNNNPVMYIDSNGTDAILITAYTFGGGGIPIVGHSALLFEYGGYWYLTQYTGSKDDKSTAHIELIEVGNDLENSLNDNFGFENTSIFPIKFNGYETVYLEGDYSSVHDLAEGYNGTDYGGYNLISNNCLDYVQELLGTTSGEGRDVIIQAYHKISFIMVPALYSTGTKISSAISEGVQTIGTIINDIYSSINAWWKSLW